VSGQVIVTNAQSPEDLRGWFSNVVIGAGPVGGSYLWSDKLQGIAIGGGPGAFVGVAFEESYSWYGIASYGNGGQWPIWNPFSEEGWGESFFDNGETGVNSGIGQHLILQQ